MIATLFACVLASLTSSASAHFTQSVFTYPSCSSAAPAVDPLNFLLYGDGVYPVSELSRYDIFGGLTGWGSQSGSHQYFRSHGGCQEQSTQRNLGDDPFKRHSRFFRMPGGYQIRGGATWQVDFGDAHYEHKTACVGGGRNHNVDQHHNFGSGYDAAAYNVAALYAKQGWFDHAVYMREHAGRTFVQGCNRRRVGWNGIVYFLYTPN